MSDHADNEVQTEPVETTPNQNITDTYEADMLAAFVQKEDKIPFYQRALDKMMVTGEPNLKWTWSWWSFFGGWAFLLYRKSYLPALGFFLLSMTLGMLFPLNLILMIILGGIGPYFVIKRYYRLKSEIEGHHSEAYARVQAMKAVGGFHTWVPWVIVGFYLILIVLTVMMQMMVVAGMN